MSSMRLVLLGRVLVLVVEVGANAQRAGALGDLLDGKLAAPAACGAARQRRCRRRSRRELLFGNCLPWVGMSPVTRPPRRGRRRRRFGVDGCGPDVSPGKQNKLRNFFARVNPAPLPRQGDDALHLLGRSSRPVVSMTTASSAWRSGAVSRPLSMASRPCSSAASARTSSSGGSATPRSSSRRRARSSASAIRYALSSASGKTTVPMSRPSATSPPRAPDSRRASISHSRTAGTAAICDTCAFTSRRADLDAHVLAADGHHVAALGGAAVHVHAGPARRGVSCAHPSGWMPARSAARVMAR